MQELTFTDIRKAYRERYGKKLRTDNDWLKKKLDWLHVDYDGERCLIEAFDSQKECGKIVELLHACGEARGEKDILKRYQLLLGTIPEEYLKKFPDTIRYHQGYVTWLINRRKNKGGEMKCAFNSLKTMLSLMEKEIAEYSDSELADLIKKTASAGDAGFTTVMKRYAIWFLKYIRSGETEDIKFDVEMSLLRRESIRLDEDFYTPEEWGAFAENFFDADRHLERACSDWKYARYWLYALLHMSLAWRKSDILSIPALEGLPLPQRCALKDPASYSFSTSEAQGIIRHAKLAAEQYHAKKTGAKKHFNIPLAALLPTAAALAVCEQWRKREGCGALFGKGSISVGKMTGMFGLETDFTSLKANRTLLSMFNEAAGGMDGLSGMAGTLTSFMRSHKTSVSGLADITAVYLRSTYDERESASMGRQSIDRGLFGWLYDRLLGMSGIRQGSFKENTELIARMKKALPPQKAEGIAGALYELLKEREALLDELCSWHEDEIRGRTSLLLSGKLLSRVDDVCCLLSGECPYPTEDKCLLCRYSIPTVFSLALAGDELARLLTELGETDENDAVDRIRLTYQIGKLVTTLKEASARFGREYVGACVDLEGINAMIEAGTPKMIFYGGKRR